MCKFEICWYPENQKCPGLSGYSQDDCDVQLDVLGRLKPNECKCGKLSILTPLGAQVRSSLLRSAAV